VNSLNRWIGAIDHRTSGETRCRIRDGRYGPGFASIMIEQCVTLQSSTMNFLENKKFDTISIVSPHN